VFKKFLKGEKHFFKIIDIKFWKNWSACYFE